MTADEMERLRQVIKQGSLSLIPETTAMQIGGPQNKSTSGLLVQGTIPNLYNRPITQSPAGPHGIQPGNWSTTYSKTLTAEEKPALAPVLDKYGTTAAVLLPTVIDGKFVTDDEAVDKFLKTGQHLGIFDKWQSAEPYSQALHNSQQAIGNLYGRTSGQ